MNSNEHDDPAQQQALHWFVRSRAVDFSPTEREQLTQWLADDARHQQAFEQLSDTWNDLDQLAPRLYKLRPTPGRARRRELLRGALAFGALAGIGLLYWQNLEPPTRHLESARGQHLQIALPQGGQMWLDADSAVDLVESQPVRITLLRGGIYLQVEHGNGLRVLAAGATLRDIGTRFAVSLHGDQAQVAVAEGRVEISTGLASKQIGAGQGLTFNANELLAEQRLDTRNIAAWREGRWHFAGTPLAELANELRRQHNLQLTFDDPKLARLAVSGDFEIKRPDKVLWAVSQVHDLRLHHPESHVYRLQHR